MKSAIEQPPGCDPQGGRDPVDNFDRRVARAALEIADVSSVQSNFERERLLGQPALGPECAQVAGETKADIHAATVAAMSSVSLQTMSDNAERDHYQPLLRQPGDEGMIGRLERVPLREVWMHEAHDFTQWLELNIDVLNDALDLEIVNVDREQAAGKFSIDLVAEDIHGRQLIIENQLEKSDHDHLGKLITYLTAALSKQLHRHLPDWLASFVAGLRSAF